MKTKITIFICLLFVGVLSAQERRWTLQECVEYAVENNLTIEQFELDLQAAEIDRSDAVGDFLPNFNGQISTSGNTGLILDPTTNSLITGTIFSASSNMTSSVTLFDGLRNVKTLQRAEMNALASRYRLDDLVDDIKLNVANAYLDILSNKEALKTLKAQYAVTEQDLKRTEELVKNGVVARGDLLEIEATAANQEQQIVNTENLVLISRINLAQLLQITDYANFYIADQEYNIPTTDILQYSPKVIFDKAVSFRNDIKFSETNVDLAEKDLEISKGAIWPTLAGFFNYNTRYSDQTRNPVTGDPIPFSDQLYLNDGISYGAQLNIPIFNGWSTRNSIKRSQIAVQRAELQLEQDKLALETTINQAYVDVENSAKSYEAAVKNLEARRLAYEYSKERFDVGLMNAFDFSQAQARVDDAEASVIRTKYDYIFRIKVLEFFYGLPIVLE